MKWILVLLILITNFSLAAVWEDTFQWNQDWEDQYSKWVRHDLATDIFTNPNSQFYGIETDCADFVIAQRVIFSYLKKLPFYSSQSKNNLITKLDSIASEVDRVKAFIDLLSDSYGSYFLANNLSYSIPLNEIKSGDIFIYHEKSGNFHTYLVKDLRENGNFELWYSTVPKAVRKIIKRIGMPARPTTGRPYGFRRLRTPSQIDTILALPSKNNEQYTLIRELGANKAMVRVKQLVRKRPETLKEAVKRRVANSCALMDSRVDSIKMTIEMFNQKGFRCLNSIEYYNYSTPSRDSVLYESLMGLAKLWVKVKKHSRETELENEDVEMALDYLVGKDHRTEAKSELKKICGIRIPINFRQYILRYKKGVLSSNPHHQISSRWGAKTEITVPSWDSIKKCRKH